MEPAPLTDDPARPASRLQRYLGPTKLPPSRGVTQTIASLVTSEPGSAHPAGPRSGPRSESGSHHCGRAARLPFLASPLTGSPAAKVCGLRGSVDRASGLLYGLTFNLALTPGLWLPGGTPSRRAYIGPGSSTSSFARYLGLPASTGVSLAWLRFPVAAGSADHRGTSTYVPAIRIRFYFIAGVWFWRPVLAGVFGPFDPPSL